MIMHLLLKTSIEHSNTKNSITCPVDGNFNHLNVRENYNPKKIDRPETHTKGDSVKQTNCLN
jgi:hypothetical protein